MNDKIGTGSTIEASENGINIKYNIVIFGDLNGDGINSVLDLIKIKAHLTNKVILNDCFLVAGDISKNGNISLIDLLIIKDHIVEGVTIVQDF